MIKENIQRIKSGLPSNVTIVAATKKRTIKEIQQAIDSGIEIIGENYVQDTLPKWQQLKGKVRFHMIGHLQSNKVKKAVEIFDCIQTIDSIKIAHEINKRAEAINKIMDVMIEVNIAKEPNKSGCMPEDCLDLVEQIKTLKNLNLIGLMTMAPYFEDPEKDRPYFKEMKILFDKSKLGILSMGMSDSYKIAVEEGTNMVRLGTVIFGARK